MKNLIAKLKPYISWQELLIHLALIALYFTSINVEWTADWFGPSDRPPILAPITAIALPFFCYLNTFYLIPTFLKGKKWYRFFIIILLLYTVAEAIRTLLAIEIGNSNQTFVQLFTGKESLIFSSSSVLWLSLLFSFAYRFTRDWIVNQVTIQKLEHEKRKMELHLLKSQIDPHFLFNNLNALDDLIDRDTQLAKRYLFQLSQLYRYLINNLEEDVVSLKEEIAFIHNYIFLQEVRFGKLYHFKIKPLSIEEENLLIPPAALQTLVENVSKHNYANLDKPLEVSISVEDEKLIISHLKRLKKSTHSLGTGLANLEKRHALLSDQELQIIEDDNFTVILPLIKKLNG